MKHVRNQFPAVLGIMTDRFMPNSAKIRSWIRQGRTAGFRRVIVFTPTDVGLKERRVRAFLRDGGRWRTIDSPLPDIAHDIGYYRHPAVVRRVRRIKYNRLIPFTGYGLGTKTDIESILAGHPDLAPHLIPGMTPQNVEDAMRYVQSIGHVIVKPINGSKGRGIKRVRIEQPNHTYIVEENGVRTRRLSALSMRKQWRRWLQQDRYMIQTWLDLSGPRGRPFDVRLLMHKDGEGSWRTGGIAVREAGSGRITANVHSGGAIIPLAAYVRRLQHPIRAEHIADDCERIARMAALHLEQVKQRRLVELGFDFGIDPSGKRWLIEVNIKPGRQVIRTLYGRAYAEAGMRSQIEYAKYVLKQADPHQFIK